jgi:hypothetical protein
VAFSVVEYTDEVWTLSFSLEFLHTLLSWARPG